MFFYYFFHSLFRGQLTRITIGYFRVISILMILLVFRNEEGRYLEVF